VAEKASELKFSGVGSGEPDQSAFMALETLTLGVQGKRTMWTTLKQVQSRYPALASTNLDELIERADTQHDVLERERLAAGVLALGTTKTSAMSG
jgi:predicted alpha/beta-hydrolase family hydrolase